MGARRRPPDSGGSTPRALAGPSVRVLRDRGTWLASPLASSLTVTVHPSSLLRAATPEARAEARAAFVADLREVARRLGKEATKAGTSLALSRAGDR